MLINPEEINSILSLSGNDVTKRGKKYFEQDRVRIQEVLYSSDEEYIIKNKVEGRYIYDVNINKDKNKIKYKCNCPTLAERITPCKHIIASLFDIYINNSKYTDFNKGSLPVEFEDRNLLAGKKVIVEEFTKSKYENPIITYFEELELDEYTKKQEVSIVPTLEMTGIRSSNLSVSFKIGKNRMYMLKDIYEFGQNMIQKKTVKYGKELEFKHDKEAFLKESQKLLHFIVKKTNEYSEFAKLDDYFSINKSYKSLINLKYGALDDFFDIMVEKQIQMQGSEYSDTITFVVEDPEIRMDIYEKEDSIALEITNIEELNVYEGQDYIYVLNKDRLYRCSNEFAKKIIPIIKELKSKRNDELKIDKSNATSFCEYLIPNVKDLAILKVEEDFVKKYKAKKLTTKIYLDIDEKKNIVGKVKFCYGDIEIDPFDKNNKLKCNRNMVQEKRTLDILKLNKFLINKKTNVIFISNEEDIYNFMTKGINNFTKKFKVLVTERFKARNIINPKSISMGIRVKNDLLELDIENLDFDEEEFKNMLKTYKLKKKYFRLKNGDFVDIESSGMNKLLNITDSIGVSQKDILDGKIVIPKYRTMYLDSILKSEKIKVQKDEKFQKIIKDITNNHDENFLVPENMKEILRSYQITGYNWLKTLDTYGFGGILADDMGLGKTLQVISVLQDEKESTAKTSIVVCPSSLYINWKKEINKFAKDIKTLVISGSAKEREDLIKKMSDYDVIITSYDLLKRDIEKYSEYTFKYIIADEAQYIKNNNTQNAKALKKLKGLTRFALTGTPIENSLSELWSIFDFCMPGYLFSYKRFKEDIESKIIKDNDESANKRLQKLVTPFVLRRTKKEVLKELPEKTESVTYNKMNVAQEKIYNAYLAKAKQEMSNEIEENGFEKSRMKILSIITRLRQICCHPSLFIENYNGESSKLDLCMQIVEDAVSSGHKMLIFSQFTSMFNIMVKELEKRGISYYILTGSTKVDSRVEMVDEFNQNKDIPVFLVSLKAGGTGLNLIGADMVIHFDPWWNLSVQNQATDRAYRIGQKNNVQVFKLITENSIEEKIQKLQEKKQNLTDNIIKSGESFINKMSKDEIMELFE